MSFQSIFSKLMYSAKFLQRGNTINVTGKVIQHADQSLEKPRYDMGLQDNRHVVLSHAKIKVVIYTCLKAGFIS